MLSGLTSATGVRPSSISIKHMHSDKHFDRGIQPSAFNLRICYTLLMKYIMRPAYADWSIIAATVIAVIFVILVVIYREAFFTPPFILALFVITALVIYVTVTLTILIVKAIKEEDR